MPAPETREANLYRMEGVDLTLCQYLRMTREKKSARAIFEALKIEMAQPHITASALAAICQERQQPKVQHSRSYMKATPNGARSGRFTTATPARK